MENLVARNNLLDDPQALRQTAADEGLLFFRSFLDPAAILDVRRQILALCEEAGWLKKGSDPIEGIARPGVAWVEPQPEFMQVYNRIMRMETFHALAHAEPLTSLFDTFFEEPAIVHARNIARIVFPNNVKYTTPAHQDFVHVQGTENTWTAWIPLGDCAREMGALALMPGSHRQGVLETHTAYGAGGLGIDTDALPYPWQTADFECGDVVVFHCLTVHKALPNATADRMRLSVDFRYQGVSQPATAGSFLPHYQQVSWEEVYEGWRSDALKYYWKKHDLRFVDFTREYHEAARARSGAER